MKIVEWPDEVLRMCSEVKDSPALMALVQELSDGTSSLRLLAMREAVSTSDFARAATLEAEARAWEDMPHLIHDLASEWRQRTRQ